MAWVTNESRDGKFASVSEATPRCELGLFIDLAMDSPLSAYVSKEACLN